MTYLKFDKFCCIFDFWATMGTIPGQFRDNFRNTFVDNFSYNFVHIPYAYPISKDHFFVFKEVFSENSDLMYGLYSRAASNQERLKMARVR